MKKLLSFILALTLCGALLAACGGGGSSSSSSSSSSSGQASSEDSSTGEIDNHELLAIIAKIEEAQPIQEGVEVDDQVLALLMNINMDNVAAYAAKVTQLNQNVDCIIVLQAKPGLAAAVGADLEAYRQAMVASASNYAEFAGEKVKAENGRVVTRGDIVVLAILGDGEAILEEGGPDAVYGPIDTAIDEALK